MNIDEFREKLVEFMNERFENVVFSLQQVDKLNNRSYHGITGRRDDSNVCPTLDISGLFEEYQDGMPIERAAEQLEGMFRKAFDQLPVYDRDVLENYNAIKDKLILQLVRIEGNEKMLSKIPYERMADLALICRVELEHNEHGIASTIVNNTLLKNYEISKDRLFRDAKENAPRLHPGKVSNLAEMLNIFSPSPAYDDSPLNIATTEDQLNGACVIAYPGFLDQAAEKIGGSFFVLPSSVHEVLFVKDDRGFRSKELCDMVRSINNSEVRPEDQLSDIAYHYDAENRAFEKAEEWEERSEREAYAEVEAEAILADAPAPAVMTQTMTMLLVNPGEPPKEVQIPGDLKSLQKTVQGSIEVTYPFKEPVGLICNEEGKINGMELNRALRDENGEVYDIIAGPFLVAGLGEEDFRSLTPDETKHFEKLFHQPETFVRMGKSILPVPLPDEAERRHKERSNQPKLKTQEHGAL